MRSIQVYDPALCCSSGVCGEEVDQALVDFSAAVTTAKNEGIELVRHNLASDPTAFAESETVRNFLQISGADGLPVVLVDDVIALSGSYPTLDQLRTFAGVEKQTAAAPVGVTELPVAGQASGGCGCGPEGCC